MDLYSAFMRGLFAKVKRQTTQQLYCSTSHSRRSGTDYTVLPANYTVPASTLWAFTRWRIPRQWRHLVSQHISYHAVIGNVKGSRKVFRDLHPDSDQHFRSQWTNHLPPALRSPDLSESAFKRALKTHLFSTARRHWDVFMILALDIDIQTYLLTQHQNLIISTGSPLAPAYRVWLTVDTVNAFVSYPAHRMTDRQASQIA